jgi:hypothetical protein
MPIVQHPHLTVEELLAEPEFFYVQTQGSVPTLALTVTYRAILTGADRLIHEHGRVGFVERIWIEGVNLRLGLEGLPVAPAGGGEHQELDREHTYLVEKKLITDRIGLLGDKPIRVAIQIEPAFPLTHKDVTNTVTLPGLTAQIPLASARLKRAVNWIREQLFGRFSPEP